MKAVIALYASFNLKTRTAPHRANLKDDYDSLAQEALALKKQKAVEAWFFHPVAEILYNDRPGL